MQEKRENASKNTQKKARKPKQAKVKKKPSSKKK